MSDEWLFDQLSSLLQFPVPQDMIDYISSITNARDLEDYMKTLLDYDNPQHKKFLQTLLHKRKESSPFSHLVYGYKKNEVEEDYIAPKMEKKKKEKNKSQNNAKSQNNMKPPPEPLPVAETSKDKSKKKKYVNLYSQEGQTRDVVMLKGRHKCDCQASKHKLINNCLKCGRIVCEQEGSGPCLFCGNLVCSREEQEVLSSGTKQSSHLLQKLMDKKPAGYDAAIEQRNRLLEYDRTSEKRTRIIDDESDYFSTNSVWLSAAEREKLKKKEEEVYARKHQSRREQTLTLDLGLRKMIETKPQTDFDLNELDDVLRDISSSVNNSQTGYCETDNTDPTINLHPKYDENVMYEVERGRRGSGTRAATSGTKVQDKEFQEMVDLGLCLSLHQPYASLLATGVKEHEGRTWYSSHRGRLWIASAAKPPLDSEIREMETLYRELKGTMIFPLTYPTGCLLGCVNVVDCLPQEEYRQKFPDGESSCPFVFICDSPQELPIRFPVSGKHKIWNLDPLIHQAAQKALQRVAKIKSEKNSQSFLRNKMFKKLSEEFV
ncbi:activating signal cointegrator 1-like [Macrosteles quadrilineatus]|uniref:activating signal cointegrator 1-like n=1 Tax=Macrosteles quadrilineatus TaxID=74068 RepID=UPI0023E3323D|nr:activating signal cointegrator 1-like [Macrosteles quadrilineatus]